MRETISSLLRQIRLHLDLLVLLAMLASVGWMMAARGLTGLRQKLWLLVPLLLAGALVCLVGPGRLFPKQPFEGPQLLIVSQNHALTLLDIPGLLWAGFGMLLGGWLLSDRLRATRR